MTKRGAGKTAEPSAATFTARPNAGVLQRQHSFGPTLAVQREATGPIVHPAAPDLVRNVLESPGQPLDAKTRSDMEPRFGYDFSSVRVHTDDTAAASARAVNANAYTAGSHVAFADGRFAPDSPSGQQLLAHELTHVVQQATGPVDGTSIGGGFQVSHPDDAFERRAGVNGTAIRRETEDATGHDADRSAIADRAGTHIQRDSLGLSTGQGDTSKNANTAAAVSSWSALGGAIAGLGSMTAAFIALKYSARQAEAAEDPPVQEPTTGGVTSTHIELPEVKGIDLKGHDETTVEDEEQTVISGLKGDVPIPQDEKTALTKELRTRKQTKKTVHKEKEQADDQKSFTVLRLQQGTENQADFILTLRTSGTDVKGGATEDGEIKGYLGGSAEANAGVTFRASPGKPDEKGVGTVRLLFGGTNVPPRKNPSGTEGVLWGRAKRDDYHVQRFSAAARFSGAGEFKGFDTLFATPRERSVVQRGSGEKEPLVTIALVDSDVDQKKRLEPVNPATPQETPAATPPKP